LASIVPVFAQGEDAMSLSQKNISSLSTSLVL
jgi:hypothetical protein